MIVHLFLKCSVPLASIWVEGKVELDGHCGRDVARRGKVVRVWQFAAKAGPAFVPLLPAALVVRRHGSELLDAELAERLLPLKARMGIEMSSESHSAIQYLKNIENSAQWIVKILVVHVLYMSI